jgi:predicted MFS family arabinose efflux permease
MRSVLGGIGEAFADRNFRFYTIGSITSWLSFFVQAVAVSWTTWELTHSTRWLAIVALIDAASNIVLMPLGGVVADRFDRLRVRLAAYALATLQAVALTLLAWSGTLSIGWLAAMAFVHGTAHAFSIPAAYGFLPRFVAREKLPSAIAVAAAYTQLAVFAGPALAGWILLHWGAAAAFASNVAGYAIFFASVAFLRTPAGHRPPVGPSGPRGSIHDDFLEGLRAILRHRGIAPILAIMAFGDALFSGIYQMAPAYADKILGMGVEGLSALLAAAGLGATVSALWLAHGGAARAAPATILWAFLGFLACVGALKLASNAPTALLAMAGVGGCFELCRTGKVSLLQISIPDALRGRVLSTQFLLLRLAGALGALALGAAAEPWGLRAPFLLLALLALFAWSAAFGRRKTIGAAFAAPNEA